MLQNSILQSWATADGRFAAMTAGGRTRILATDAPAPAGIVVESALLISPERLLESIGAGTGQSFEGVASYAYHAEYPGEIAPGCVSADYLEEEAEVAERGFVLLCLSMVAAHAEATDDRHLLACLRGTIARLAERCIGGLSGLSVGLAHGSSFLAVGSAGAAVIFLRLESVEVDTVEAAYIHRRHFRAVRHRAPRKGFHTAA